MLLENKRLESLDIWEINMVSTGNKYDFKLKVIFFK